MNDILVGSPNIPCDATPVGKDETENPERRRWGTPRDFAAEGFEAKAHWNSGTDSTFSISIAAISFPAAASRFLAAQELVLSAL